MLLVTPFHHQFRYVYFQKQNRNAFKILSLQSTASASAAFGEKETAFMDKSLPSKTMSEDCSWLCCRLLSDYDGTTWCLWVLRQCYHHFPVCLALKLLEGKECFFLLLVGDLVNQTGKQRVQGVVDERNFKNCKTWLKGTHL